MSDTCGKLDLELISSDQGFRWRSCCQPQGNNLKLLLLQGHRRSSIVGSFKAVFDLRICRFESIRLDDWMCSDRGFIAQGSTFIWFRLTRRRQGKLRLRFTCFGGRPVKRRRMFVIKRWSLHLWKSQTVSITTSTSVFWIANRVSRRYCYVYRLTRRFWSTSSMSDSF